MIPEAAVEAAWEQARSDSDGYPYPERDEIRRILEAAAPHMLVGDTGGMNMTEAEFQEAIRAAKVEAWDEGHEEGWLNRNDGLTEPAGRKHNPYRK